MSPTRLRGHGDWGEMHGTDFYEIIIATKEVLRHPFLRAPFSVSSTYATHTYHGIGGGESSAINEKGVIISSPKATNFFVVRG